MDSELQLVAQMIEKAAVPEEVFGLATPGSVDERLNWLTRQYRPLVKKTHPEAYIGDRVSYGMAQMVFTKLAKFRAEAEAAIKKGTYGQNTIAKHNPFTLVSGRRTYTLTPFPESGDMAELWTTDFEGCPALIKLVNDPADNELLEAERDHLEAFRLRLGQNPWSACVPKIYDSFEVEGGGNRRRANVMEKFEGFYSALAVRKLLPQGVDGRTIAWMFKRLLILLDWSHKRGFIHGSVLPPHVMFYPDNDGGASPRDARKHSVRLVDWCYSLKFSGGTSKLKAWCPEFREFYPPELLASKQASPATDLYMAGKTAAFLLGGNSSTGEIPSAVPAELAACIARCFCPRADRRPKDSGAYFDQFEAVVRKVFGAPRYHEFHLPYANA